MYKESFHGFVPPLSVQCSNGGVVNVFVNVIKRDKDHDSLRWMADMIDGKPGISCEVKIEGE